MEEKSDINKKPGLLISLVPLVSVIGLLLGSLLIFDIDIHIPLVMGTIIASVIAVFAYKVPWSDLEDGIFTSIRSAMQAILITGIIGFIIGAWIMGGVVPAIIFYGLKILSPKFFLVTCLVICAVVSIATGSSWTTAGTIGIALIGIGVGMGIPAHVTAGAIISGAYFGDKMSPLSDTTNLAPAMAGTNLFTHIRHMAYTTGTSFIIAAIGFTIINFKFVSGSLDQNLINGILESLQDNYAINPILLLPPIFIIAMMVFKIPAIPGLIMSVFLGLFCAIGFQGAGISEIGEVLQYGVISETGNEVVDELLTRGGLQNMMWTLSLILCSLSFGGVMERSGMLKTIAASILKLAKGTGSLIAATIGTTIFMNMATGEQYLSILITGRMYKDEYAKRGLAPENLSRTLEDGGTITSPLIPWSTCAVAMSTYLGVSTLEYLPFCLLNLVNPIVAIVFGFTGFTIKKLDKSEKIKQPEESLEPLTEI